MTVPAASLTSGAKSERVLCFGAVAAAYVLNVCFSGLSVIDDAYITFRHSANLAHYGQLVFNLGERVEGITNLLWALLLAASELALGTPMAATSVILSLLLLPWALFRVYQVVQETTGKPLLGAAAALMLALNPHFVLATTNGLEAGLFAALIAELCFRVVRAQFTGCGLLLGLMFLTRPDGVALVVATAVAVRLRTGRLVAFLPGLCLLACCVIGATAFRQLYYGQWVPNSIVAKSYPLSLFPQLVWAGLKYSASFGLVNGYLLLPFGLLAAHWRRVQSLPLETRTLLGFALVALLGSWLVMLRNGGDWMPHYRLFFQYGPVWAVVFALAVEVASVDNRGLIAVGVWPLSLLAIAAVQNRGRILELNTSAGPFYDECTRRLSGVLDPSDTVSAEAIGYISYHLINTRFHDPLGLNDLFIARHGTPAIRFGKENPNYTMEIVGPSVALWQTGSHLWHLQPQVLSHYQIRRFGSDAGWQSTVVCIREDRVPGIARVFADWPVVDGLPPDAHRAAGN